MAPICQRGGLNADTTTASTTTETTTERPECPYDWETYIGNGSYVKCFKYCGDYAYATYAEDNCQALGGHLASIHSLEEQNFLSSTYYTTSYSRTWIGAVDTDHNNVWEWIDGSDFDFSYWISGSEPDGGSYYTVMDFGYSSSGYWNDMTYNHNYPYIS